MQAYLQKYVDNAISKTINVPADIDISSYTTILERAYWLGIKGCTVFRPNAVTGKALDVICAKTCH